MNSKAEIPINTIRKQFIKDDFLLPILSIKKPMNKLPKTSPTPKVAMHNIEV